MGDINRIRCVFNARQWVSSVLSHHKNLKLDFDSNLLLALALKCWKCASDASNSAFCGRNLDTKNLTQEQKLASYVECTTPLNFNGKGEEKVQKCEVYKQLSELKQCFHIINIDEMLSLKGCPQIYPDHWCV